MDTATIEAIKTVAIEAIKILGPAVIAAFATYKLSKIQFTSKLKELERRHEFNAREVLFNYYKNRQSKLSDDYTKLTGSLNQVLGQAAAFTELTEEQSDKFMKILSEDINLFSKITPTELKLIAKDMELNGFKESEEYSKLISFKDVMNNLEKGNSLDSLQRNINSIIEVYHMIIVCNDMLIQKQMDKLFKKYLE
jgi:hypothetical protein